jgi:hypothetical protein
MPKTMESKLLKGANNLFSYVNKQILALNQSKYFAGIMIIILNIASKFVNIKVSKTMESYLKFSFSRDILVFAITWMGTRDIYIALGMTIIFTIVVDFIMNEESTFCILPESFTDYHVSKLDSIAPTQDEIAKAKIVLENAEKFKKESDSLEPQEHETFDHKINNIYNK